MPPLSARRRFREFGVWFGSVITSRASVLGVVSESPVDGAVLER
jgi:hypothetical protein